LFPFDITKFMFYFVRCYHGPLVCQ